MLDELKDYLDITWEDEDTDRKVNNILSRATAQIEEFAGGEIDLIADKTSRGLVMDCARYIWNNVYEEFKINFRGDLIMLRAKYQVKRANEREEESV